MTATATHAELSSVTQMNGGTRAGLLLPVTQEDQKLCSAELWARAWSMPPLLAVSFIIRETCSEQVQPNSKFMGKTQQRE